MKQRHRAQNPRVALYARYAMFPHASPRCSLEETKCRPTSAAATRNFVTSLPSCNDALSWISTRFPPVSDRLSIRREREGETGEEEGANCPYPRGVKREEEESATTPSPLLHLSVAGVEKKIEFQLDPRGEQGRFVRVNPFMAGAQWRDGNRFENKSNIEK